MISTVNKFGWYYNLSAALIDGKCSDFYYRSRMISALCYCYYKNVHHTHFSSSGKFNVILPSVWSPYRRYPKNPNPEYNSTTTNIPKFKTPGQPRKLWGVFMLFSRGITCKIEIPQNKQRVRVWTNSIHWIYSYLVSKAIPLLWVCIKSQ